MIRYIVFLALIALAPLSLIAQHTPGDAHGKITGRIIDSATSQPIAYATVILYRQGETKILNGATADESGKFVLDNIANGNYRVMVDFIGYRKVYKDNISLSPKASIISLGNISLPEIHLKVVTVTGEKAIIENRIDKIVYNVDRDVTSQGGVATDVLKKVPQVTVDVDGNVEVQGNSSVRFLINGKPSTIFGNNLTDVLQSIPASQIQSIEVLTSPGAKYDAEGTGGIINIILKKSEVRGISGSISGSAGTRLENGSINLSARKGKFGAHAYLSGNTNIPSTTLTDLDRHSTDAASATATELIQHGSSKFIRHGYQSGTGIDWDISPRDNFSATLSYNLFGYSGDGLTSQQTTTQDANGNVLLNMYNLVHNSSLYQSTNLDYSASYTRHFKKENQQLVVLYSSSNEVNHSNFTQSQNTASDSIISGTRGLNPGTENETDISVDYTQPIGKTATFETGAKTVLRNINSNTNAYILDKETGDYIYNPYQSSILNYTSNVYAFYLSGSFRLFNFINVKPGLRYERTENKASFSNSENIDIPSYNTLAPSLLLSRDIGHNQTLKFSYSYRIERPDYRKLNPFLNATDPKNINTGNPALQPEIAENWEFGYNKTFDKGSNLYISLFYRTSDNDIKPYVTYYPSFKIGDSTYTNVAVTNYANVGLEQKTGLSLSGSVPFTSKFNARGNIMVFDRHIINRLIPGQNANGVDYRININLTYQIDSSLTAEVFGMFNSQVTSIQGKTPSWSFYNFAIRKQIWHKKASIGFTTTDPFSKYVVMKTNVAGDNFNLYTLRQIPYQSFGISFTYKFGKLEFKKERERDNNQDNGGGMDQQ